DVVTASGDKLLGGPQAGLIVGRRDLIEACRRHPLARALRVDKLTLAALAATLDLYVAERLDEIPAWRMLLEPMESIRARAERLAGRLSAGLRPEVRTDASAPGGGSLPGESLPTAVIVLRGASAEALAARLRSGRPPVVGRVVDGCLALDLRTVAPGEEAALTAALEAVCT
ncbi:MAG TPA: L-seryl-tRNA(Sec) selenium transferase, partial [Limnochordia bacterium]|nr:L-seryl-tRNA(Sec) selenium transferase [Limnochordia bacterium]